MTCSFIHDQKLSRCAFYYKFYNFTNLVIESADCVVYPEYETIE